MKWMVLAGVLCLMGNGGMVTTSTRSVVASGPKLPPSALPAQVTDLRVVAATDTSLVLTWTEVSSGLTVPAKYVMRVDTLGAQGFQWWTVPDVTTGGCAAPLYGATAAGGRVHACVLGGLMARRAYQVQVVAYTGTLGSATFGPFSNLAIGPTATRVGAMLVSRPPMNLDSVDIAAASITDYGVVRFPLRGRFRFGDRQATFYDSLGVVVARGYLMVTKP